MDLKDIKKLIDLVDKSDLSEIVIEEDGTKISLRKGQSSERIPEVKEFNSSSSPLPEPVETVPPVEVALPLGKQHHSVESPMVGTFYRASSEGSDPYVQEGDKVKKGQVVCIVEAMKLMNEIETEYAGTIESILVENGQPVEFGEPLFVVKKDD